MIIGHGKILDYFAAARADKTLAHTYCFSGLRQVGKRAVAKKIAAEILGVAEERLLIHPDFLYVERSEDEKSGKLKKEISVAQARELRTRLQRKSWLGGYQAAVINEVEFLNSESASALLKALEEPAEKSIIFLLTENDHLLLPTIRSRAQVFYFSLVNESEMRAGLLDNGYSKDRLDEILPLAAGRPGRARQLLDDEEFYKEQITERARWKELAGLPLYKKEKILDRLLNEKDDSGRARDKLDGLMELWMLCWREELVSKKNSSGRSPVQARSIIDNLTRARRLLQQNVNPRLVLEDLVMML